MSIFVQKTADMKEYEKKTGKHAIWNGIITESFKKWRRRTSGSIKEKERITTLVSPETKKLWQEYVDKHKISTISQLIRTAVKNYVELEPKLSYIKDVSNLTKDLKSPLTPIKGFSQIIIDNYSDKLDTEILLKIKEIYSQSQKLEDKITEILSVIEPEQYKQEYDILIIDNDVPTITVLKDFFELNGYSSKGVTNGTKGLEELTRATPKLILISIILPDIKGNDVYHKIKSKKVFQGIPIFFITVMSEEEAKKITNVTGAKGYFLKPFDLAKLKSVFHYL